MTFQTLSQAQASCQAERVEAEQAAADMKAAFDQLQAARQALESERSFWDGSTLGTGAGIATIVGACLLPEPFSKAVCIGGIIGGGLGVGASEVDRQNDIANAEATVAQAELLYDVASRLAAQLQLTYGACLWHHISKPGSGP